jgi:hypothetical protein
VGGVSGGEPGAGAVLLGLLVERMMAPVALTGGDERDERTV